MSVYLYICFGGFSSVILRPWTEEIEESIESRRITRLSESLLSNFTKNRIKKKNKLKYHNT